MNPLTNVRNVSKLNEQDINNGRFDHNLTWHAQYKDSAYIFIGGLPYDLTEGDILCVFSQYGEIVNINLVRDKKTGKFKGYGFLCYEDQRSTILAVDNFNAIKLGGRTIRVDHVSEYRTPKGDEKDDTGKYKDKIETGCAPKTPSPERIEEILLDYKPEKKKKKKDKKKKKNKKKSNSKSDSDGDVDNIKNDHKRPEFDKTHLNSHRHVEESERYRQKDYEKKYNRNTNSYSGDNRHKDDGRLAEEHQHRKRLTSPSNPRYRKRRHSRSDSLDKR